jgi:zinc protease
MSKLNGPSYALWGLILLALIGLISVARHSQQIPQNRLSSTPNNDNSLQSLSELDGKAPATRQLNIQRWQTAEGACVLFVAAHELPMFDLHLTFAAGSSHDGKAPGLAMLTNAMLGQGAPDKDASAIAAGFENLGAVFGNGAYRDMATVTLRSLSAPAQRQPALQLFTQVIGQPTFPVDSLARIKNQVLADFEFQKQNPGRLASLKLFERLYGEHPYGHQSEGNPQSIASIQHAQLQDFYDKAYAAGNAVIALVGDLSREQAEAMAADVSAALPKGPKLASISEPKEPEAGRTHIEFPSNQTHLLIAQLGIDRNDPDYPALSLGNAVLGGNGFGTRLMTEVREKRGLSYGVYSGFSAMQARGPFMIHLQTRAELSEGTLHLVKDVLRDFLAQGPTAQELDAVKREMSGSFPLSTASNSDIVNQLSFIGFYNLPLTYMQDFITQVQTLSTEQVKAAMAKHLDVEKLVIVTAGPSVEQHDLPPPTGTPAELPVGVPEH